MPESDYSNGTIEILGIDPGNSTGICVLTVDSYTFDIIKVDSWLIELDVLTNSKNDIVRLRFLSNIIKRILKRFNIRIMGVELAFMNIKFPKAGIKLAQYITTIIQTIDQYDKRMTVYTLAPKLVKTSFTKNGTAEKDDMLKEIKSRNLDDILDIESMSQHEIDAFAVANTVLEYYKRNPLMVVAF